MSDLMRWPQRVEYLDAAEILLVVGNHDTGIRLGDGGDDRIEAAARATAGLAIRHQSSPRQSGLLIERQHASGEDRPRSRRS